MTWLPDRLQGLACRVLLPRAYDPQRRRHPLVVFLHGSGERGDDDGAQLRNGITAFEHDPLAGFDAIVIAPQASREMTFGGCWYGGESDTQSAVVALTRELAGRASVDAARVYLVGFSMGAIGGWHIVADERNAGLFAAAVLIAGDVDVDATVASRAAARVPIWAVHGERDELVTNANIRVLDARAALPALRYTELRGEGHDVCRQTFAHLPLWQWLFAARARTA